MKVLQVLNSYYFFNKLGRYPSAARNVSCFAFLKCKLTVVIRVLMLAANLQKIFLFSFSFFPMFYIKN
jgi:hypothetical protein